MQKSITERVRQSFVPMLIARPVSAIGGLLVLILLSRNLALADYGSYFTVWAAAEILILASNGGLVHAAYRYISATEMSDGSLHPKGPTDLLIIARAMTLIAASVISYSVVTANVPFVADLIDPRYGIFLAIIVFGEGLARYFEAIFDSMLSQHRSQTTLVSRTIIKLIGYVFLIVYGQGITLLQAFYVEVSAVLIGALLGLALIVNLRWGKQLNEHGPEFSFRRMMRFAMPAYVAQLIGLTYGFDALKLALGKVAGQEAVALFGFAYSLASVAQRYMPTNLLAGVFRPVFVASATKKQADGSSLTSQLTNMVAKINWLFIAPLLCIAIPASGDLAMMLGGEKYVAAGPILLVMLSGLLVVGIHATLSMLSLARENSWPVLTATIFATIGLPVGIQMAETHGAIGMAAAFLVSEILWVFVCYWMMRETESETLNLDYLGFGKILLSISVGAGISLFAIFSLPIFWLVASGFSLLIFIAACFLLGIFSKHERQWLLQATPLEKLIRKRLGK